MKNLKVAKRDSYMFYTEVVKTKRNSLKDPNYTNRLTLLNDSIKNAYLEYDECFKRNELNKLKRLGYRGQELIDLHKLYAYNHILFQDLMNEITTTEHNRKNVTCQNCTIGEISSFDHFVPQTEFAEFVVNPKNLVPSCSKCNSYKNAVWRDVDKTLLLNLYTDILPKEQYLFVKLGVTDTDIDVTFYIANVNKIADNVFKLIDNHYTKLHLFERFKENTDRVITPLINSVIPLINHLSMDEIRKIVIDTSLLNMNAFGFNYWKSILEIALISNSDFVNKFLLIHKK
jgi:5-methylcytosine-specific restriction endonuclease McrA